MKDQAPYLLKVFIAAGAVLTPVMPVMIVIVVLIAVDFVTGVYAAIRNKHVISSRKIGNTVAKLMLLNLAIMSGFLIETYIVPEVPWVKVIAGFVAVVELTSIVENIHKATGINILVALRDYVARYVPEPKKKDNDSKRNK